MHISEIIKKNFHDNLELNKISLNKVLPQIELATTTIINVTDNAGKVMSCGNGGSAGDAQHIVSELVNRFEKERKEIAAVSLNSDTATITSIANDYDYKYIAIDDKCHDDCKIISDSKIDGCIDVPPNNEYELTNPTFSTSLTVS